MLLCTHGRRDVCCGALGTKLHGELTAGALPADIVLHRTSHTGGHRFAPTALLLPAGTAWAWLDSRVIAGILNRTLNPSEAVAHYRGCMGLDGPEVQTVDAQLLRSHGWTWLDTPRRGSVIERGDGRCVVDMTYRTRGGDDVRTVRALLRLARRSPVPRCGEPLQVAEAEQQEWELVEMDDTATSTSNVVCS